MKNKVIIICVIIVFVSIDIYIFRYVHNQEAIIRESVFTGVFTNEKLLSDMNLSDDFINEIGLEIIKNDSKSVRMNAVDVCALSKNDKGLPYLKYAAIFDNDDKVRRRALSRIQDLSSKKLLQLLRTTSSFRPFDSLIIQNANTIFEFSSQIKLLDVSHLNRADLIKLFPSLGLKNNQQNDGVNIIKFKKLEYLELRKLNLKQIPHEICMLKKLRSLYLAKNKIKDINKAFASLSELKTLDLSSNSLTTISGELSNCTKLEWLNISNNNIYSVIDEVNKLKNLRFLGVDRDKISREEILELKNKNPNLILYPSGM